MSIIFVGAVGSSYIVLEELIKKKADISAVFTLDNKYISNVSTYKSLEPLTSKADIPLYKIRNINDKENIELITKLNPDVIFVIGWSQLIKKELIDIPRYGCIGFHPSLLPKNRGRGVIPWQIINEEKDTGITLFYIDEGTDTGDIIGQKKIPINSNDTSTTIYNKLMEELRELIRENIDDILNGTVNRIKQDENFATYCAKRVPEDGYIDWSKSNEEIHNLIRAVTKPYPGAFTYYKGKKIIVWDSELIEEDNFVALEGQIVKIIKNHGVVVKTGNGLIMLKNIEVDGEEMNSSKYFKHEGHKLGINFVKEIENLREKVDILEDRLNGVTK